jgi:hypothetical protein
MQTFLPYADFKQSAIVLDYKRLGKQRVETLQILNAIDGLSKGWVNHPATNLWRGYETALAYYGMQICQEWIERGYKDSLLPRFTERFLEGELELPPIIGDSRLHLSHQSNLIRKDPNFYVPKFGVEVPNDLPYYWGNKEGE